MVRWQGFVGPKSSSMEIVCCKLVPAEEHGIPAVQAASEQSCVIADKDIDIVRDI